MVTGVRSQVAVKVFGDELGELKRISEAVARLLKDIPGSRDIRIERLAGQQSLMVDIDRKAIARFGLNVAHVQNLIESAIGGKAVTTLYEGERRYEVAVRFPQGARDSVEAIAATLLPAPGGAQVPLASVASIRLVDGPAQISRESGKRRVVVGANVEGRDLAGFVDEVQRRIDAGVRVPEGYHFVYGGQFENMQRAMSTLAVIVPLTVAAIYFLLFLLFRSVRLAALIILVLPFASIGGLVGLFVTGEYVSVPASVGFIALWGIAVLNGVVLVSSIRRLREDGVAVAEAVYRGLRAALPPGDDDRHGGAARAGAVPVRERPRRRGAAAAGHRGHRRADLVDAAHAGRAADALPLVRRGADRGLSRRLRRPPHTTRNPHDDHEGNPRRRAPGPRAAAARRAACHTGFPGRHLLARRRLQRARSAIEHHGIREELAELSEKTMLSVLCDEAAVPRIRAAILDACRVGQIGDGLVWVVDVGESTAHRRRRGGPAAVGRRGRRPARRKPSGVTRPARAACARSGAAVRGRRVGGRGGQRGRRGRHWEQAGGCPARRAARPAVSRQAAAALVRRAGGRSAQRVSSSRAAHSR